MKKVLFFLLFITGTATGLSQNETTSNNWESYAIVDGVEILSKETNCYATNVPDQIAVLLKIINPTNTGIVIEWDMVVWYNGDQATDNVADDENHFRIEVDANGTVEGDCSIPYGALYIYKDFITYKTPTKMSKFELQNIQVSKLEK